MSGISPLTAVGPVVSRKTAETAEKIRQLRDELNDLFPEREPLINQLMYALLTREHLLIYGTFGTGKSWLVECLFGAFTGASLFSVEFSKFMTESNIIGIPNPKILREEGRVWHERKGTIMDAHFAEFDELFDANDLLLRSLLGILNERRFNRGVQLEKTHLHTSLASTNDDPEQQVKRFPKLSAVVDRFLFQTGVSYLETEEGRRRMLENYLARKRPQTHIPFADLSELAKTVHDLPFTDLALVDLHQRIAAAFQKESDLVISDRRLCKALEAVKANAVLYGREALVPEDLLAAMWVYCKGNDADEQNNFTAIANPMIEALVKERQPDVVRTQMQLLDELEKRLPAGVGNAGATPIPNDNLIELRRALIALRGEVNGLAPGHATIEDRKKRLLATIDKTNANVGRLIDGEPIQ